MVWQIIILFLVLLVLPVLVGSIFSGVEHKGLNLPGERADLSVGWVSGGVGTVDPDAPGKGFFQRGDTVYGIWWGDAVVCPGYGDKKARQIAGREQYCRRA